MLLWDEQHGWNRINAHKAPQTASRIWYEAQIRLEFPGSWQECYMRFLLFHLYNSGLNSVRINGFNIRPYDRTGTKIDRLEYHPNPDGVILPGLAAGVGSGQDVRVEGVLSP